MTLNKVRYPGPGCLVEFMQGNAPVQAIVLDEQGGRLRLYGVNKRESSLSSSRLLPWSGPSLGADLSRQRMDEALEEHKKLRAAIAAAIAPLEVWELTQGEVGTTSAEWLAGLVWDKPTIDQEAALGHALLGAKTHFRFAPPDFEIFPHHVVELRLAEAESTRIRERFAVSGAQFFQKLWDLSCRRRGPLSAEELPEEDLAAKLRELLLARIADPERSEDAAVWRLLVKSLPDVPHVALTLAIAWGLVPEHYNFWLDRIGYERGEAWADAYADECRLVVEKAEKELPLLEGEAAAFVSVDPATTKDRDDAFFVARDDDGGFTATIALACPALAWPFGGELDRAVLKRSSSMYLPEGDEHMLPAAIGRDIFSLDAGTPRLCLAVTLRIAPSGEVLACAPRLCRAAAAANLDLESCEAALRAAEAPGEEGVPEAARPHANMLRAALDLVRALVSWRVSHGAVITERPDPIIQVRGQGGAAEVSIEDGPEAALSHMVVGELMVLCNGALALWCKERGIPLLYRTQDVALPREFAGVWTRPHEIARVVRALPPASLECVPKRHAGLGVDAYAPFSAPIRRYADMLNQGQVAFFLRTGAPLLSGEQLASQLALIASSGDAVNQAQRMRPRYWKLVFFRLQGDKRWWDAVVTDENEAFVTITLPWAQLLVRGRRRLFDEKVSSGMPVQVRLGKVHPLLGEIQVLETREA